MTLDGVHHVTCITGDARGTSTSTPAFLGLRLVKKTVNQDDPTVYHLFYADENGTPGSDITFFEYPGRDTDGREPGWGTRFNGRSLGRGTRLLGERLAPGRRRHRDDLVDSSRTLRACATARRLDSSDAPLMADHPRFRRSSRSTGSTVSASDRSGAEPSPSRALWVHSRGLSHLGGAWPDIAADLYAHDEPPAGRGLGGAGTVHHVAWASSMEDHMAWHDRVTAAGMQPPLR